MLQNVTIKEIIVQQTSNTRTKNRKEHEDLTWFGSNLAYVHKKRTWEFY